jgi:hypothetical protein
MAETTIETGDNMTKEIKISITWEQCELIAHYYEFPTSVLLLTPGYMRAKMKGKKRRNSIERKVKRLAEIKKVIIDIMR